MAPKYVIRVIRRPKPGQGFEVLERLLAFRKAGGTPGMTTMAVFSAERDDHLVGSV
jgi:hypothetical protein